VYQTIREYQASPKSIDEILQKVETGFVPFMTNAPGFRDYTCIDGGNGTLTSVSLFENRSDGEKFNVLAKTWVNEHLGSLLPTAPRVITGEVRTHATGKVLAS
jgi:hypothetical protein